MHPDFLIYDEIKRRDRNSWEPVPLHLPLHAPRNHPGDDQDDGDDPSQDRGVTIIVLIDYTEIDM